MFFSPGGCYCDIPNTWIGCSDIRNCFFVCSTCTSIDMHSFDWRQFCIYRYKENASRWVIIILMVKKQYVSNPCFIYQTKRSQSDNFKSNLCAYYKINSMKLHFSDCLMLVCSSNKKKGVCFIVICFFNIWFNPKSHMISKILYIL